MLESCLKGKRCYKGYSCLCIKLLPGFNTFVVDFTIAVYRNSVHKTRNIFVECGNVCNTLIPQFINAVDGSVIFINPFLVNFLHFVLARTLSDDCVCFNASN